MSIIDISDLHKTYGEVDALNGLDLSIREGEIYGFLGPNGAGKTTAIKIIMGLIPPDEGEVMVNGVNVVEEGLQVRKHIGYLPEDVNLYEDMSVRDNLRFFCDLKGCTTEVIDGLLDEFQVEGDPDEKVSSLSKGMVQRLGLSQTLIGDPDILVLDEPTSGLDPEMRRWIKDKILELQEMGKTIFLSSHVLQEVEELCDRVGIISSGTLMTEDSVSDLMAELKLDHRLEFSIEGATEALKDVKKLDCVERPRIEEGMLKLYCRGEKKMDVIKYLLDRGYVITNFRVKEPELEEVFVKLMEGEN